MSHVPAPPVRRTQGCAPVAECTAPCEQAASLLTPGTQTHDSKQTKEGRQYDYTPEAEFMKQEGGGEPILSKGWATHRIRHLVCHVSIHGGKKSDEFPVVPPRTNFCPLKLFTLRLCWASVFVLFASGSPMLWMITAKSLIY